MITTEMSQITIGHETIWDFGFRYNLTLMDLPELEVLMVKFEVEINRTERAHESRYWQITDILGKIYREIMNRKLTNHIRHIENNREI
jgi:hypothetical protein